MSSLKLAGQELSLMYCMVNKILSGPTTEMVVGVFVSAGKVLLSGTVLDAMG
jgi:hypothetical protein